MMNSIRSAFRSFLIALALTAAPSLAFAQTDNGLEPSAYARFGLPAADHVWTASDFTAAGGAIAQVPPEQLPRWRDSRSSPLFARFVDTQSLAPCAVENAESATRLQACIDILTGFNGIVGRYVTASSADSTLLGDIPPLMSMMLHIAASIKPTADAFSATLDRNDPTYADRMGGLAQMHRGMLMIVQGSVMLLHDERRYYNDVGSLEVARALAETYPVLAVTLPAVERTEIERQLREVANNDPSADVRAALAQFAA